MTVRRHAPLFVLLAAALLAAACQPRIGNRDHSFGNELAGDLDGNGVVNADDCVDPAAACAGPQPFVWGSINSPYYQNENGDPYSSRCLTGTSCSPNPNNPEFRPEGYTYGIEVAEAGQTVTVQIYDAPAYYMPSNNATGDSGSFRTGYGIFREDGSEVTASTDPALSMGGACDEGPGGRVFPGQYQASPYHNRWWTLCTFTADVAGTYPLVVVTSDLPADPSTGSVACLEPTPCAESVVNGAVRRGINSYAVRATATVGPPPVVAAIGDMSIYTPTRDAQTEIELIDVPSSRAGQRLVVDLYDPGDGNSGTYTMSLRSPDGSAPPCTLSYGLMSGVRTDPPAVTEPPLATCEFRTRDPNASPPNRFNSRWVRLTVDLPADHACTGDCWWTLRTIASGAATDRITIAVGFETPA